MKADDDDTCLKMPMVFRLGSRWLLMLARSLVSSFFNVVGVGVKAYGPLKIGLCSH